MKVQRADVAVFVTCETCGWSEVHSLPSRERGFFGGRQVKDFRAEAKVHAGNLGHDVAFEVRHLTAFKGEVAHAAEDTIDYSTSKFQNALAEKAHAAVLEGGSDESITDAEGTVLFDLIRDVDGETVVLRLDSQGFVWIEWSGGSAEWAVTGTKHWANLLTEFGQAETDDE